jgi:hypothetical protein
VRLLIAVLAATTMLAASPVQQRFDAGETLDR